MEKLYLITQSFPFGKIEKSFIQPELHYLCKKYKVTIITCAGDKDYMDEGLRSQTDPDIHVVRYPGSFLSLKEKLFLGVRGLCSLLFWKEVCLIFKENKDIRKKIYSSLAFFGISVKFMNWLKKQNLVGRNEHFLFYSFWYTEPVLAGILLKKHFFNMKLVTRIHGWDLYNERWEGGRQPFKKLINKSIDKVIFLSNEGCDYYMKHFGDHRYEKKYSICEMGVSGDDMMGPWNHTDVFQIVSCSSVIPLKRIELIIDGLTLIRDKKINWIHFGDGTSFQSIKEYAAGCLGNHKNIQFKFMGFVSNDYIKEYYKKNGVDCFITTSSTEGCPVSIQEALSYGIPIIGTNVGSIPSMIEGNGILLNSNPVPEDIAEAILSISELSMEEQKNMRLASLELWRTKYDMKKNGEKLLTIMSSI